MRMHFRTDGWHYADIKAKGESFDQHYPPDSFITAEEREQWKKHFDETPKAEKGDVWRIHWANDRGIAGYAICCIVCGRVHTWTQARNCSTKKGDGTCAHNSGENLSSCWNWSGSAEEGTLTATPSLMVVTEVCEWHCNYHGFITNGEIT